VEMYLLVALNTVLDLLMGCTSGAVRVSDGEGDEGVRMMHFRTLDWGMDVLRRVVVQLDFVEKPEGGVFARSVTYVGFVGVLTGVRSVFQCSFLYLNCACLGLNILTLLQKGSQSIIKLPSKPQ
jgi:hypothetical protein